MAADAKRHGDVLPDGEPGQQRRLLEHHADLGRRAVDALVRQREGAGVGAVEAGEQAQQRALAAARRPDQADEFAVAHRHVEMVERQHRLAGHGGIDFDDALGLDQRVGARQSGRHGRAARVEGRGDIHRAKPRMAGGITQNIAPPFEAVFLFYLRRLFYTAAARNRYARIARTSKAATGRWNPLSSSSPTEAVSASVSTAVWTLPSIRIWPLLASPQRRAARFTTRPMAV